MLSAVKLRYLHEKGLTGQRSDIQGLYFHTRSKKQSHWEIRLKKGDNRLVISLGKYPDLLARTARDITPAVRRAIKQGYPIEHVRSALRLTTDPDELHTLLKHGFSQNEPLQKTFQEVAKEWYRDHLLPGLSVGVYQRQVINQLRDHIFTQIGSKAIETITRKELISLISLI